MAVPYTAKKTDLISGEHGVRSMYVRLTTTIDLRDREEGLQHTTETLARKHARRDGEHVHVEALGASPRPDEVEDRAGAHRDGVVDLGHDEREADGVPVRDPVPVLLRDPEVLDDDGQHGKDAERDRGESGGLGDGELGRRDGDGDGRPRADAGRAVRALARLWGVQDAGRRGGEEDEEADVEEDGDDGTAQLRDELVARLRAEQVPGLEVTAHVRGLGGGAGGNDTGSQVNRLRGAAREAGALADATEYKLRSLQIVHQSSAAVFHAVHMRPQINGAATTHLRDSGDGVDVGGARALDADEREAEAEDEGEDGLADVHVEHGGEDRAGHDDAKEQTGGPPERGHTVLARGQILVLLSVVIGVFAEPREDVQVDTGLVHV